MALIDGLGLPQQLLGFVELALATKSFGKIVQIKRMFWRIRAELLRGDPYGAAQLRDRTVQVTLAVQIHALLVGVVQCIIVGLRI